MKILWDVFIHLVCGKIAQLVVGNVHQSLDLVHVDILLCEPLFDSCPAALTTARAMVPAALVNFVDGNDAEPVVLLFLRRCIIRQLRDVDASCLIRVRLQFAVLI